MADFTESEELGNWEDQADSGVLDKRLEEMSLDLKSKEDKQKQASGVGAGSMLVADDSGRTQYQPQVRILRRDAKGPSSQAQNSSSSSRQAGNPASSSKHSKSLQQREAEYAQARLRIFGSLPPKDDEEEEESNDTGDDSQTESISKQSSPQIVKPDLSSPHMAILRQPKGPDGTSGFNNMVKPDNT